MRAELLPVSVSPDMRDVVEVDPPDCDVHVRLDTDGVLVIDFVRCTRVTLAAAERAFDRHRALSPDRPLPVMLMGAHVGRVDYAAQRFTSSPQVAALRSAMAVVTYGFLQRHLVRMFLMYHRPPHPMEVFADEPSARAWLLRHKDKVT
jgi:hypothetical protein